MGGETAACRANPLLHGCRGWSDDEVASGPPPPAERRGSEAVRLQALLPQDWLSIVIVILVSLGILLNVLRRGHNGLLATLCQVLSLFAFVQIRRLRVVLRQQVLLSTSLPPSLHFPPRSGCFAVLVDRAVLWPDGRLTAGYRLEGSALGIPRRDNQALVERVMVCGCR